MNLDSVATSVCLGNRMAHRCAREGVTFVLDLTERKRAEEEHERLRELESQLAHDSGCLSQNATLKSSFSIQAWRPMHSRSDERLPEDRGPMDVAARTPH
jgi:hypothetical protein